MGVVASKVLLIHLCPQSVPGRDGMVVGDQSGCVYGVKTEGDHPGSRSRWVWQDINLGRKVGRRPRLQTRLWLLTQPLICR